MTREQMIEAIYRFTTIAEDDEIASQLRADGETIAKLARSLHVAGEAAAHADTEIARLTEERDAAMAAADMTWFWQIVDRDGLADVPSDERDALALLVKQRDKALDAATARKVDRDGAISAKKSANAERDAALARVAELEAEALRWRLHLEQIVDPDGPSNAICRAREALKGTP
jgi:hypothetical protein